MTGFIDIDDSVQDAQQTSGQTMVRIACQLQALMAKGFSQNHVELPRVRTVSTAYDYPHKGTHKIEINLDTPEFFRQIVEGLVKAVPQAHIRTKRMCHISLAYFNKHVKTDNLMSVEQARLLDDMARDIVYNSGFNVMDMSTNLWDVAFYELAFKSDVLSVPHKFNQIARWQL
ncbi:hypothetical protein GGI07_005692 [Coemansia sp. Benny D115]|nr:hypothetical protein GGI07_005692 [Coemansia sp. Benny D115]